MRRDDREGPYMAAKQEGGFWNVWDLRTHKTASYPTDRKRAFEEARTLNRAWREAVAEQGAS